MDVGWVMTLKPDHTLVLVTEPEGSPEGVPGIWRIEGEQLVTEYDFGIFNRRLGIDAPPDKRIKRERIIRIARDTMELEGGYPYTRVK